MTMKMIIYKYSSTDIYVVGFANSIEEFNRINNDKTYPYNYEQDKLSVKELTPDVFAMARIEGDSNFKDYLK